MNANNPWRLLYVIPLLPLTILSWLLGFVFENMAMAFDAGRSYGENS